MLILFAYPYPDINIRLLLYAICFNKYQFLGSKTLLFVVQMVRFRIVNGPLLSGKWPSNIF